MNICVYCLLLECFAICLRRGCSGRVYAVTLMLHGTINNLDLFFCYSIGATRQHKGPLCGKIVQMNANKCVYTRARSSTHTYTHASPTKPFEKREEKLTKWAKWWKSIVFPHVFKVRLKWWIRITGGAVTTLEWWGRLLYLVPFIFNVSAQQQRMQITVSLAARTLDGRMNNFPLFWGRKIPKPKYIYHPIECNNRFAFNFDLIVLCFRASHSPSPPQKSSDFTFIDKLNCWAGQSRKWIRRV